eukprot:SRR837773.4777.p2 GENE.SRR837773.4777~~SRR837773.4777.p2  ORF type:complete len:219 (-),score=48.29 SRR837773.4777:2-610(-)
MWARKCGARERWPSRVRVIIQSFMTGTIGLVVYDTMANLDMNSLDIKGESYTGVGDDAPSRHVQCLSKWPRRNNPNLLEAWSPASWTMWVQYQRDVNSYVEEHQCNASAREVGVYIHQECSTVAFPISQLLPQVGYPMGGHARIYNDILYLYAHLFLLFAFLSWFAFLVHDLALLHPEKKNFVLDYSGMYQSFPIPKGTKET